MSTRIEALMVAAKLKRIDIAASIKCDTSTISRLLSGRHETPQQTLLLDMLAEKHGLPHLTAAAFAAAAASGDVSSPACRKGEACASPSGSFAAGGDA